MNQDLGPVWKKRVSSTYYSELRGSIQQDKPRNHHPLEQQQPKNEGSLWAIRVNSVMLSDKQVAVTFSNDKKPLRQNSKNPNPHIFTCFR